MWPENDPEIRFEALRWIADALWKDYLPEIQSMLDDPKLDYRLFEAALAAINTLQGKASQGVTDTKMLIDRITNPQTPPRIAAYALRLVPAGNEGLGLDALKVLLDQNNLELTQEVVRTLALRKDQESHKVLSQILKRESIQESIRLDALAGLIGTADDEIKGMIKQLAQDPSNPLGLEAQRVARQSGWIPNPHVSDPSRSTTSVDQWLSRLDAIEGAPDSQAGRRIFFHVAGASCSQCHRYDGRGNVVGPDLSLISKQGSRREILASILEPNREVAPQFYTTLLQLADGTEFTGILLRSSSNEVYRNNYGQEVTFQKRDIENRKELRSSLMPSGLLDTLSDREIRDLLEFLVNGS
jgi:putative heme-binding domain-containing protein